MKIDPKKSQNRKIPPSPLQLSTEEIWSMIPYDMKRYSLSKFTKKIRNWKPVECPCRLCK